MIVNVNCKKVKEDKKNREQKMYSLVGYTGFVGSNLALTDAFNRLYNTKNIETAYGTRPDLLVYAGVRGEKFLANSNPQKDKMLIDEAMINIEKIAPKKLVLISTIDIYKTSIGVDEESETNIEGLAPYGLHRLELEKYVEKHFKDYLIVRLPGLFGNNIKKNFIYDFIHFIPALLNEKKYCELSEQSEIIKESYLKQDNGFYKCEAGEAKRRNLKKEFERLGFSALNFTDSRGIFQFYNLANLWYDISLALNNGIKKLNLATEPVSIAKLYNYLTGKDFDNKLTQTPSHYDFRSVYAHFWGGKNGYLYNNTVILKDIKTFVENYKK